jgi:hypothetical protein
MSIRKHLINLGIIGIIAGSLYLSKDRLEEAYYKYQDDGVVVYKECKVITQYPDGVIKQSQVIERDNYILPPLAVEEKLLIPKKEKTL